MGAPASAKNDEAAYGQQLLTRKYSLLKILGDFFSRLMRHKQTVIAVEIDWGGHSRLSHSFNRHPQVRNTFDSGHKADPE